jgi:ribosomal protein L11 methyltransferase
MLYAELDPFEPLAIQEYESGGGWRVFFRTPAQRDGARRALASEFENALDVHPVDVDDEDWARRSQEALRAVRAGRLVIAPPWDVPQSSDKRQATSDRATTDNASRQPLAAAGIRDPGSGIRSHPASRIPHPDLVIVIDPSTGFGTGHHPTTRLCLELLQELDLRGKRVIDVGCGSGVLAIAAAKLDAREVIAIDNDPDAVRNARENVRRNAVDVDVIEAALPAISIAPGDVVLANLTASVLERFASSIRKVITAAGTVIVSGFSPYQVDGVARALNVSAAKIVQDGDWAALSGSVRL